MDSAHFIAAMHAGLVMQKRHSCVPDDEDELAKGKIKAILRHGKS